MSMTHRSTRTRLRVVGGRVRHMPKKCNRTGKENYIDRVQADIALGDILRNIRRSATEPRRSYKCEFCRYWHHTSQDKMAHSA